MRKRCQVIENNSENLINLLNELFVVLGRSDQHSHTSSNHEDIIELQDVRMSPIASLRNRNYASGAPDNLDLAKFPPSFRITRSYGTSVRSGLRHRAARNSHRPKMLHAIKRGASVIRASIPKIKDVNIIDEYSRVIFPVAFLLFNVGYWVFYVTEWWGSVSKLLWSSIKVTCSSVFF